jgi:transposase
VEITREDLGVFFSRVLPLLDERQSRLIAGAFGDLLGRGGKTAVAEASGLARNTVIAGAKEIRSGASASDRVRRPGGGRPRAIDLDPNLLVELDALVNAESRGDPMSNLRWTLKSTYALARDLTERGYQASATLVRGLLHDLGYSLQATSKQSEGTNHPDRDEQFEHINATAEGFLAAGQPVISVDTKKKELVGNYANGGREWQPKGEPVEVKVHDFIDPEMGKAIPYGVFDLGANEGWVNVGDDADTSAFAVNAIRSWWEQMGKFRYPDATRLLVTADAGGSNGYRVRAWKLELAKLAEETGLEITVCHYPPGTSKWNKIEHRLFSFITMNWRGRPLTSYRTIVELISATTNEKGLKVRAALDQNHYPTGVKVTDEELAAIAMTRNDWHGDWNYTLHPSARK